MTIHFAYKASPEKVAALKKLREHLKKISAVNRGVWFKADLIHGGVMIRLFKQEHRYEIMVARTDQSDDLLADVDKPDFHDRLIEELRHQGFEI